VQGQTVLGACSGLGGRKCSLVSGTITDGLHGVVLLSVGGGPPASSGTLSLTLSYTPPNLASCRFTPLQLPGGREWGRGAVVQSAATVDTQKVAATWVNYVDGAAVPLERDSRYGIVSDCQPL
jgi:hypothetical protein